MARGDGIHRTNARNMRLTAAKISNAQQHNEREKESYVNQDIVPERTRLNIHFKKPTAGYAEIFEQMKEDGIISTRPQLIRHAKELSLYTVMRFFVIDSMAYDNIEKQLHAVRPDFIEILPALMPKVISRICDLSPVPVIAGGLISDKEDVMQMIQAGAISISSTNENVWFL